MSIKDYKRNNNRGKGNVVEQRRRHIINNIGVKYQPEQYIMIDNNYTHYPYAFCARYQGFLTRNMSLVHNCEGSHCDKFTLYKPAIPKNHKGKGNRKAQDARRAKYNDLVPKRDKEFELIDGNKTYKPYIYCTKYNKFLTGNQANCNNCERNNCEHVKPVDWAIEQGLDNNVDNSDIIE